MEIVYSHAIVEMEKKDQWKAIIDSLSLEWEADPSNINNLLCLSLEVWYVLTYFVGSLKNTDDLKWEDLLHQLKALYNQGSKTFQDDAYLNLCFGYMMKVMPYYFLTKERNSPDIWADCGSEMIRKAYSLDPIDPGIALIYNSIFGQSSIPSETGKTPAYVDLVKPSDSRISIYFRNILS